MHYQKLRNDRNEVLENLDATAYEPMPSDHEKDVESHFKSYIESAEIGWVKGKTYTRDKDVQARYSFRNERKKSAKGKPDYLFYDASANLLCVCDVKSTRIGALDGLADAKAYVEAVVGDYGVATCLAAGFDGVSFLMEYRSDNGWERVLIGDSELSFMPTPALLQFIAQSQNRIRDVDETEKVDKNLLRNFFKRCDEIIRLSQIGTSAPEKFIELSAIIFLKMFSLKQYDAQYIAQGNLPIWQYARQGLTPRINGDFLTWLNTHYKNLFVGNQPPVLIRLDADRLREITRLVDRLFSTYELSDFTNIKGDILEFFQMESKDRKIGEFFTPRHVIQLMVSLVDPRVVTLNRVKQKHYIERIYDPACGTGGFLIEVFNRYKSRYLTTLKDLTKLKDNVFHGTELKANTTLLAKLNMILIGDGHNDIVNENAFGYKKIATLPKKTDSLGNFVPVPPENVTYYEEQREKFYHIVGDRARKVTVESDGTMYWVFDELGQKIEVPPDDIVTIDKKKRASDGAPIKKSDGKYFKRQYVRHFELKNDLQEDKIPYRYEDVNAVNPRLLQSTVDGKPNPKCHAHFGDFDIVLANQPFGLSEPPKADYLFLKHMIASLHEDKRGETQRYGRIACIVGNGFLHDPDFEAERAELQAHYFVKCIIALPEKVFAPYVKTIKSNILIIETRRPEEWEQTYFVKLRHDGLTQDDRRTPEPDKSEIKKLLKLWRRWDYEERVDPDSGENLLRPAQEEERGFAEFHQVEPSSWAVNYYIRPTIPTFSFDTHALDSLVAEVDEVIRPEDFANPDDLVDVLGVSRTYGVITSERKLGKEYNQKYKIIHDGEFAYNPARVNIGSVAIHRGADSLISPFYTVFRLTGDELVDRYLLFFLKSKFGRDQIESFNFGGIRNSLSFDDLKRIQVPFMPPEQQRSFLLLLDNAYSANVKLVDTFKALGRAGIPDSLALIGSPDSYDLITLGELIQKTSKPAYGISEKSDNTPDGTPILKMDNIFPIIDDIVDPNDIDTITADKAMLEKYRVQRDDILINRTNSFELVGKSGIFDSDMTTVYASYLMRITLKEQYSPAYVALFLNLASTRRTIREQYAVQSGGQYNVNLETLRSLPIRYPKSDSLVQDSVVALRQYHESLKGIGRLASVLDKEISSAFDSLLSD